MINLRWLGHSCFLAECGGYSILLDPFAPGSVPGLRDIDEQVNQVLCSHQHHDHNYRQAARLLPYPGQPPIHVTALPSFHDDCHGSQRGENIIHLLTGGGVRVAHMGDLGCMPDAGVLDQLKAVDAMLIPVGGHYTVDPQKAYEVVKASAPRVVIPMHYRSPDFGFDVIGPVEDFLALCKDWRRLESDSVSVAPDMEPGTVVLTYAK